MKEIFSFIPAAILPALVTPGVSSHQGQVDWLFDKERLVILLIAAGFWFFTRSMAKTIAFGLISLYLVTYGI